jgi:hypothetical protein
VAAGLLALNLPKSFCLISVSFRTMIDKRCYICQDQKKNQKGNAQEVTSQPHPKFQVDSMESLWDCGTEQVSKQIFRVETLKR